MPGFNGTGPVGAGNLTGRGMGPCGKVETIETVSRLGCGRSNHRGSGTRYGMGFRLGRGMGFGRGFGLGYGHGMRAFNAQGIQTDAGRGLKAILSEQRDHLKAQPDTIDKRLETL